MSLIRGLAEFATSLRAESLPPEVTHSVRQRILDIAGLCVAALPLETSASAIDHVVRQGGVPEALTFGTPQPLPAPSAAFAGGVLAHSLDYDDTHLPSVLHPSASIVPTALAAGQASRASGARIIEAVTAGLEICVRLGMAGYDKDSGNSVFFERGQHATSICGAVASAATAGMLYGLDATGIAHAMGIAVSMGSGVIEGNRAGGTVKRLHCGFAAQAGVNAALLARAGFTGPPTALEGRFGFFQAWLDGRFNSAPLVDGLGIEWEIPRIFFKPYPANHFTHAGIDAAIALRNEGLRADDVASITLGVPTPCVRTIGQPIDVKRSPATGYLAQFSGPYTVAAALLGGGGLGLGLNDFSDALARDPVRRSLMEKIDVVAEPECDAIYPQQFPAVLTVATTRGETLVEKVLVNRGGPEHPLSDDELRVKFDENVLRVFDDKTARAIEEAVMRLGEGGQTSAILHSAAISIGR